MKNYMLAALAAVPCIVAVAPAATVEDYVAVIDTQLNSIKEMTSILATVKDKATADAAAEKMQAIVKSSEEQMAKAEALGEPTPEIAAELEAILKSREKELVGIMQSMVPQMMNIMMNNCFGSEALQKTLETMGGGMPMPAGGDD